MKPELSHFVDVLDLPSKGLQVRIEAAPSELAALCKRLELAALTHLSAVLELKPWRTRGVQVTGTFRACVTQICVVSLKPVKNDLDGTLKAFFLPADLLYAQRTEIVLDEPNGEDPELLDGPELDAGELVSQHLSLSLDPYFRAPDVLFEGVEILPKSTEQAPESPFQVLENLKNQDN